MVSIFRVTFVSLLRAGKRASRAGGPNSNDTVVDGSEEAEAALRFSSLVGRSNITEDCAAGAPVCVSVSRSGFATNQSLSVSPVGNPGLSLGERWMSACCFHITVAEMEPTVSMKAAAPVAAVLQKLRRARARARQNEIVSRARLRIAQNPVGAVDFFDAPLGHLVAGVNIGVKLLGQSPIGSPDVLATGAAG